MPGEIELPIPDVGQPARGRFTYFPVVPGRLEFAIEVRAPSAGRTARGGRGGTARHARARLPARRRAPAGDVGASSTPMTARTKTRPSTCPSSPPTRSPRPSAPALEIGGGGGLRRTRPAAERPHLAGRLSRPVRHSPHRLRHATSRPTASTRSRAPKRSPRTPPASPGSCRAPIRWRKRAGGGLAEPARSRCSTPWRSRRRSPGARAPRSRGRTDQSASRIAWPRSLIEYPYLQ